MDRVKSIMDGVVNNAISRSEAAVGEIMQTVPKDYLVPATKINFFSDKKSIRMGNQHKWQIHPHAMRQICQKLELPYKYASSLLEENSWGPNLLAHNLSQLKEKKFDSNSYLVRTVDGQIRGFLSDRYARMDSGTIIDYFFEAVSNVNCVIQSFNVMDTRWYIKAIMPQIYEPFKGEYVTFGLTLGHSDYGDGALDVKAYVLRVLCLNGMVGHDAFRRVHLGRRLREGNFSARTYALDSEAVGSAVSDVVKGELSPTSIDRHLKVLKAAGEETVVPSQAFEELKKRNLVTKEENEKLIALYATADIEELPPGNTKWRIAQSLSLLAKQSETPKVRREELQIASGKVIGLDKE